ncbi:zinc ribbon domain-containing protein [Sphaerospermopsis torques-reginae]|uniref:zinc ribbon domain-containing protein n=1 Tax=Sphaerospermopsis torques-reginae TaxID=984207 RepID=UPI00267704C3|nr:zinc ribbon domain-containing protein [Sphaerospermopsis torques-reginae]
MKELEYKTKKFGCEIIIADRFYPSSKTCSHCGHRKDSLSLSERIYHCENCSFEMDRDLNAAINLSRLAKA